ncbi:MAG: hypothetical protein Kow00129_03790 [Thermoleophilia bacterium]
MTLVGAAITPHPPIIVPEIGGGRESEAVKTVHAMRELSSLAAAVEPDVFVLLSPHAPISTTRMSVGVAGRYEGGLEQFGSFGVNLAFDGDVELAEGIIRESLDRGVRAHPLGAPAEAMELDHGAVVPLYFLTQPMAHTPRLVLLSFSFEGPAAHLDFGAAIGAAIESHRARVVFVASGDLSHRLVPGAPAGYSPEGEEFDRRVAEAVAQGSPEALLSIPREMIEAAGECGYRSLLVLFGLLGGQEFRSRLLSYEGPFGVGYLVAWISPVHRQKGVESPAGAPRGY